MELKSRTSYRVINGIGHHFICRIAPEKKQQSLNHINPANGCRLNSNLGISVLVCSQLAEQLDGRPVRDCVIVSKPAIHTGTVACLLFLQY